MQKEDTTSPTLSIESLLISATIDAQEQRYVSTTDIPGAFMQADMVGEVHVKLEGRLGGILANLAHNCIPSTCTRKTERLSCMSN